MAAGKLIKITRKRKQDVALKPAVKRLIRKTMAGVRKDHWIDFTHDSTVSSSGTINNLVGYIANGDDYNDQSAGKIKVKYLEVSGYTYIADNFNAIRMTFYHRKDRTTAPTLAELFKETAVDNCLASHKLMTGSVAPHIKFLSDRLIKMDVQNVADVYPVEGARQWFKFKVPVNRTIRFDSANAALQEIGFCLVSDSSGAAHPSCLCYVRMHFEDL